ncbi:TetR family transcriptional regulator C-terminal domain-containing protein [Streptomyces sp. NPDC059513]
MSEALDGLYNTFGSKEELFREAVDLYGATAGSSTGRALREEPTARGAVEAMPRGNTALFADPGTPSGCMIVLAATNCSQQNREVAEHLAGCRRAVVAELEARLERAVEEGELGVDTDVRSVAAFYATVLHGLSVEARDGVSLERLAATVEQAVALWDTLVRRAAPRS